MPLEFINTRIKNNCDAGWLTLVSNDGREVTILRDAISEVSMINTQQWVYNSDGPRGPYIFGASATFRGGFGAFTGEYQ